jgi:hypothetical protein
MAASANSALVIHTGDTPNAESERPPVVLTMSFECAQIAALFAPGGLGMTSVMTGWEPDGQFVTHSW